VTQTSFSVDPGLIADPRNLLRYFFQEALRRVDAGEAVTRQICRQDERLRLGHSTYDPGQIDRLLILSIGKAGASMYEGAMAALRRDFAALPVDAVVVAPTAPPLASGLSFCTGSHPTPDQNSRDAANVVIDRLRSANERTLILFLISGGASSMIERPLDPGISVEHTADFYRSLVGSGLSIVGINVLRKHFSSVKGGRLVSLASRAFGVCTLIVSDVPEGSIGVVGSGPSVPDRATTEDCLRIFYVLRQRVTLPASILDFFAGPLLVETPKPSDPVFATSHAESILSSKDLSAAVKDLALKAGFHVEVDNCCDERAFDDAGLHLLERGRELRKRYGRSCLISVGELSVQVRPPSGLGGRNQHFALWCATRLTAPGDDLYVLSAGSDGIDGHSPAAGAMVDRTTCDRARHLGLDADRALADFNSYPLLDRIGDTLITGPTGNNLRDLRIVLSLH